MANINCPYHDYYIRQAGGSIGPAYRGTHYQKGHGIGSFLRGLWRTVFPLLKTGAKTVGEEMLHSGVDFLHDIADDKPPRESFNNRLVEAKNKLKKRVVQKIQTLAGAGCIKGRTKKRISHKRKNSEPIRSSRKRRKVVKSDIFT